MSGPVALRRLCQKIRSALGSDASLLVDANSGYSSSKAIETGKLLEQFSICHFEEPCPYWDLDETRRVKEALDLDVTGGEQDCDLATWKTIIKTKTLDVVQPDICYLGGLSRTLRVAEMAQMAGLPCTPHAANLSMVTIFTMHFLKSIPNAGPYLELSIEGEEYYPWQQELFLGDPFAVRDGHVSVPAEPGWGIEINPDWLERAQYQQSQWDAQI